MTRILAKQLLLIFEEACGKQLPKEITWITIEVLKECEVIVINKTLFVNRPHFHSLGIRNNRIYVWNSTYKIIKVWYCPILCHYLNKLMKSKVTFYIERKNK